MIDVPFLTITPGTRDGIIRDAGFEEFAKALSGLEGELSALVDKEKQAEEEKASQDILKSVQRAIKEAFLALPREEYGWLDVQGEGRNRKAGDGSTGPAASPPADLLSEADEPQAPSPGDRRFFEYSGPLFSVVVSPASCVLAVGAKRSFRAVARDKSRRLVENDVAFTWSIKEGGGSLSTTNGEMTDFTAPDEPGMTVLAVKATQGDIVCEAEGTVTVAAELVKKDEKTAGTKKGLPSYTFQRAPGELWRSRFDQANNLIVINNGHADYRYAAQKSSRKLKYICKLYAKELVLANFQGFGREELLERMVELSLYTEENLK